MWTSRLGAVVGLLLAGGSSTRASTIFDFSGTFSEDDDQASFVITLLSPQTVTILTTSYANGGFAPVLSIFGPPADGDPNLLGFNDGPGGGPCGSRSINLTTGVCLDALLGFDPVTSSNPLGILGAGSYLLVLTEQENLPNGPDLNSGFDMDGLGNFTAVPGVNDGPFVDPTNPNLTDTGNWALQVENVDSAASLPEPSTLPLVFVGLGIGVVVRHWRVRLPFASEARTTGRGKRWNNRDLKR
jgi:hypothetical protein